MRRLLGVPVVAVTFLVVMANLADARCGTCATTCSPCRCSTVMKTCRQVVYEKQEVTCYRTCYEPITEEKTVTCTKYVPETQYR